MTSVIRRHPLATAGSAAIATVSAALLAVAMSGGASIAATSHGKVTGTSMARPAMRADLAGAKKALYPVESFTQEFATNTASFCPAHSGNAPCNGAPDNYGTIDRVASHYSNGGYGNYAPFTKALTGHWMAVVSGTGAGNQGAGCPGTTATSNPGENCTGPYALFGTGKAMGVENVFPKKGFTVTDDLYLSPTTAGPVGSAVDDDVEVNNNKGTYGADDIIGACAEPTTAGSSTLGYIVSFGTALYNCTGTPVITADGWYRFVFVFSDTDGNAYVTESVRSEASGKVVATSGRQPIEIGGVAQKASQLGGPGYFWLPTEDYSGVPLANFALELGQVPAGNKP